MKNNYIIHLPAYRVSDYDREIQQIYDFIKDVAGLARLQQISGFFLGRPYLWGALGEGPAGRFDQSPLYRTDMFDCLTYVNTVLALFLGRDLKSFQQNIAAVNYRNSVIAYENRYHFMNIDWNPGNIRLGIVKDITQQIMNSNLKPIAITSHTLIDRQAWFRHRQLNDIKLLQPIDPKAAQQRLQELHGLADQLSAETSIINYLPLSTLFNEKSEPNLAVFSQIPDGAIIEIVRPDWDLRQQIGTKIDVSHLGFALYYENTLMFREASSLEKKVIDISLIDYLRNYMDHPTIKGIYVLQLLPGKLRLK